MITPQSYAELFQDDRRGAAILEDLTRRFAKNATTTGGIDAVLKTYLSQGEWNVIQFIVNMINQSQGVDANQEENQS